MQLQYISTADNVSVPIYWFCAEKPRATLLLQPALGIQAKLYCKLAEGLAEHGCATAIMEQRGHGLSSFTPGYKCSYSFNETLDCDIPAVMQWLTTEVPDVPRLIGGHSLGGHLSTIYTGMHPEQIHGVVHLACAFPYIQDYAAREQRMLRFLCTLIPLFSIVPGFYPGHLLGFGERESVGMMKQWRQWATSGSFDFDDRRQLADAVSRFSGPVLSIGFEKDNFSTTKAVERALSPFAQSTINEITLGEQEQGAYLGHTGWAKSPGGAIISIADWLDQTL
ncbi:MAG: alpha/beta fold hydrolase [Halioglobus sp.]